MRWISLLLLFFASFIAYADKYVIGFAADPLMKEFSLSASEWGIVGGSFFIMFIITSFIGGTWSDHLGTTKMIFLVLIGITIVQFGTVAIAGLWMLILYQVLLGTVEGPFFPSALSHISKLFPADLRGLAISIFIAGGTIGGAVSAPILVSMIESIGWRWTFASLGLVSLVLLIIWTLVNQSDKNKQNIGTAKAPKLKWSDIAAVLRNPACILTLALSASSFWLVVWLALWAPVYLTKVIKLTSMQMAYVMSGTGATALVLTFLISAISDRIFKKTQNYRKARVFVAGICTIIGGLSLAIMPLLGNSFFGVFVVMSLANGATFVNVSMGVQVMIKLMPERAGFMSSILALWNNTTQLVTPILTGILVQAAGADLTLGFNYSIYTMVAFLLITSILYLIFVNPDRVKETTLSGTMIV